MTLNWYFARGEGIKGSVFANAGIEIFKNHPLRSVFRESIQNSLDADSTVPLKKIEISEFEIDIQNFPGLDSYKEVLKRGKEKWPNDKRVQEFVKNAEKTLSGEKIKGLRISDFNSKGAFGASKDIYDQNPWNSLTFLEGSTVKDSETSAGSFGIGKNASFAVSDLRTVFYTTKTPEEGVHSKGVADLMSFKVNENGITMHTQKEGSLGDKFKAVEGELITLNDYSRNEYGTDVYILGFTESDEYRGNAVSYILTDFLVSIFNKKLEVKIDGILLNSENLSDYVSQYGTEETKNYYGCLTYNGKLQFNLPKVFQDEFDMAPEEASLYLLEKNGANRKVLMTRESGMTIQEMDRISKSIEFTGVFIASGVNINKFLQKLEDPKHDNWYGERYSPKSKGKKFITELNKFIKSSVLQGLRAEMSNQIEAYGVSEFLPLDLQEENPDVHKEEKVPEKVTEVSIKGKTKKPEKVNETQAKKLALLRNENGQDTEETHFNFGDEEGNLPGDNETTGGGPGDGTSGGGDTEGDNGNIPGNGSGIANVGGNGTEKNLDNTKSQFDNHSYSTIEAQDWLIAKADSIDYIYIPTKKKITKAVIEFKIVGEVSKAKPTIISAFSGETPLEYKDNKVIVDIPTKRNESRLISIKFNENESVGLEVNIYEATV